MVIRIIRKYGRLKVGDEKSVSTDVGIEIVRKGIAEIVSNEPKPADSGKIVNGTVKARKEETKQVLVVDEIEEISAKIKTSKDKTERRELYKLLNQKKRERDITT